MFVGHLAAGLIAKRIEPRLSLGWYVAAVTLADLLWPVFVLAGVEHVRIVPGATAFTPLVFESYPWSHSLATMVVWGILLAALAGWRGAPTRASVLLALMVVSHWVLDVATHAPDMPLWPGPSLRLGLALWNSIPATLIIEGAFWLVAIRLYLGSVRPRERVGPIAFWSLVVLTTVLWAFGPWSPLPPSATAVASFALVGWLTIPWAGWADRHFEMSTAVAGHR
jgi:hypothetical protein